MISTRDEQRRTPTVLVVGAGINGAAVARELALNGISVLVVDANDIAFGATSRSSRLIHGGLRYLERGDVALVRESLRERRILLDVASDFVKPLRLRIPIRRRWGGLIWSVLTLFGWEQSCLGRWWRGCFPRARERGLWLVRLGLWMYDWLANDSGPGRFRPFAGRVAAEGARQLSHPWFCEYFDARIESPERFTVALLDDARRIALEQSLRFQVFTHTMAEIRGDEVRLVDRLRRNEPLVVHPDLIVNATGAWGDATLADWQIGSPRLFGGTKGSHLVTSNRALRAALGEGGLYCEAADGRMVFVLPLGPERTLVGTTDEPFESRPEAAVAESHEVDYLIGLVNEVVPSANLTRDDIVMTCAGVRPLPFSQGKPPSAVPRGHWIDDNSRGTVPILTLIGGKLTTCRALAEEVTDRILRRVQQPRIGHSRHRPLRDPRPPVGTISGQLVLEIACHEWVRTLSDLIERRLPLFLMEPPSTARLRQLAELLAEAGVIPQAKVADEVADARARLLNLYGMTLPVENDIPATDQNGQVSPSTPR